MKQQQSTRQHQPDKETGDKLEPKKTHSQHQDQREQEQQDEDKMPPENQRPSEAAGEDFS